jgi:hypothetical protein
MPPPFAPDAAEASPADPALARNVQTFGWVAFFSETATEVSYWLLPQFLVGVLGALGRVADARLRPLPRAHGERTEGVDQ